MVFTLYPGNGNNDYNIIRNGLYTIDIKLTGIDFSDKRVTVGTIPEMQDPENLGAEKGSTGMFQVTTRPGLPWKLDPIVEVDGIAPPDTKNYMGSQTLNFSATKNEGTIRTAKFELSVIGAIPERKLNIVVNQIAGLTAFDL